MAGANDARPVIVFPFESENSLLGVRINVTETSQSAQLVGSGKMLILTNPLLTSSEVYVTLGSSSSVQATTSHFPIMPGTQTEISLPQDGTGKVTQGLWIAAICTTGNTGTLLAHLGNGN